MSNHQRLNSIPLVEAIEQGLKRKAIISGKKWVEQTKNSRLRQLEYGKQNKGPMVIDLSQGKLAERIRSEQGLQAARQADKRKYYENYGMPVPTNAEQEYQQRREIIERDAAEHERTQVEQSTASAIETWNKKYKPLIKFDEIETFKAQVASLTEAGMKKASSVGEDHLIWLKSSQLVEELYAFDPEVQKSGFIFNEYLMQGMEGTGSTKNGAALLDGWITSRAVKPENIFMRAVLFNNRTAIEQYNAGTQGFFSTVTDFTDWTTAQGAYKQFIVTVAALDAAWDEWASSEANKHYMPNFNKTFVGRAGRWSAEFLRAATQKARATGADRLIATQICSFLYARTGIFNKGITLHALMLAAVPNFDPELKKTTDASKKIEQILHDKTRAKSLEEILNNKKTRGSTRIASFIMALEAINLMFQLSKPMSVDQKLQVWGGACGLITASLEVVGVVTAATKNAAHHVVKLASNSFAIVGSAIFALYDFKGMTDQLSKDKFLTLIYASRGATYVGLALGSTKIAIDFLQNIGQAAERPALIRFSSVLVRTNFYRLISLLGSVVWLARLNLIVLGLTAIEIVYKAYIADDKLQDWCKKSAFGIDTDKYNEESKELQEFNKAFIEVIGA